MIINSTRLKRYLFLTACLFLKGLIVSSVVMASNEVIKVSAIEDQGGARIMAFFRERPSYSLYAVSETHILLTFNDTQRGGAFERDIPEGDTFDLNEARDSGVLKFDINLQKPFTRVDSSWIDDKKLIYIDITTQEDPAGVIKPFKNQASLQDIRFGFIEKGTRMVMKVDNSPSWKMEFGLPSAIKMSLIDVSNSLEKLKFGPVKRLRDVTISKTGDKATDLSLELESPLIRVSVFRMTVEDRLVLDIMDQPGEIPGDATASKGKTPVTAVLGEGAQPDDSIIEDKGNYLRMRISKKQPSTHVSSTGDNPEGAGNSGTVDIPGVETGIMAEDSQASEEDIETGNAPVGGTEVITADDGSKGTDPGTNEPPTGEAKVEQGMDDADAVGDPVKIEPKLDNALPISTELTRAMDNLTPEEAFLYGRIKQAMDIKDYEKGIALIDQFLNELPDSSLVEDMMFLKGDLYYSLWKNGDDEVIGKIVSSYQNAIDRFPESGSVPSGYIKMAQAQSSRGEEYLALGYLSLIIGQRNNIDIMPLAYLTRGKIFLRLNQYEKALADFQMIMEQYGDSEYASEADFWMANYYHAVGQYEDAEDKLAEVLDLDPAIFVEHPEYLFLRAKNCLYLEDYDGAREYLFKALNIGRQQETADMLLTRIGDTYHNQENEKEAEKYYRMVVDYYPGTEGASISRLRIADYTSDTGILDELSSYTDNESISELALLQKGYQLYDKGQYADVVDTVKQLVGKPVETETRKSAERLFYTAAEKEMAELYQGGKYKEMTDFYTSQKDLLEDNIKTETMLNIAMAFNMLKLDEQAITAFKGIRLNELKIQQRGPYFIGFAESYLNNGDIDEARELMKRAKDYNLQPEDRQRISRTLALIYIDENMLYDAYTLCESIIKGERLLPEDELADVYILAGRILNLQKRYSEAQAAIWAAPGFPDRTEDDLLRSAYMELGKSYYHTGKYTKAARSFEKGFDLDYGEDNLDYWDLRLDLAQSYLNTGQDDMARTLLTEISEGGDSISQQRAEIQIGSMDLEEQLQRLPLGRD